MLCVSMWTYVYAYVRACVCTPAVHPRSYLLSPTCTSLLTAGVTKFLHHWTLNSLSPQTLPPPSAPPSGEPMLYTTSVSFPTALQRIEFLLLVSRERLQT